MEPKRIKSGIPGLDQLMGGGLVESHIYLIEGRPGSGKTVMGNQICFYHAKQGGRSLYVTLVAESNGNLTQNLSTFDFYDESVVSKSLQYFSALETLENGGYDGLLKFLYQVVRKYESTFLVIDGFLIVKRFTKNEIEYAQFVHRLIAFLQMSRCTTFLLAPLNPAQEMRFEHTLADGIIQLSAAHEELRTLSHIEVVKTRASAHLDGHHLYEITGQGLATYPRTEQIYDQTYEKGNFHFDTKCEFNSEELNKAISGGLAKNSKTLLGGPAGVGKTLLGLDFLTAGARKGEAGLYFGFYESPSQLITLGDRISLNVSEFVKTDTLKIQWQPPIEKPLDWVIKRLFDEIRARNVKRLFLDGLDGLRQSSFYPYRISKVFAAISNELRNLGVTAVLTGELGRSEQYMSEVAWEVSTLVDNILQMRFANIRSQTYRLLKIQKIRGVAFEPSLREFWITDHGLRFASSCDSAERILAKDEKF